MIMKKLIFSIIICGFTLCSSTPWRQSLIVHGDYNAAVHNAITDFSNTNDQIKKYKVFKILNSGDYNIDDDLCYRIYIHGTDTPLYQKNPQNLIGTKSNYIPTRFEVQNGKLFLWNDENVTITKELLDIMREYNCIDSLSNIFLTIDDSNDGITYVINTNNLLKYKKIEGGNIKNSKYYKSLNSIKFKGL